MAWDVKRETLQAGRLLRESTQAVVEGDIRLPDERRDMLRALHVSGNMVITGVEVLRDEVRLDGNVAFSLLYVSEGSNTVQHMDAVAPFRHTIAMPGAEARMSARVKQRICQLEMKPQGSRSVHVSAVADLNIELLRRDTIDYVSDIMGKPAMQAQSASLPSMAFLGEGRATTVLREEMALPNTSPAVGDILSQRAVVLVEESSAMAGQVAISGVLICAMLYSAQEGQSVHDALFKIPFECQVPLEGAHAAAIARANADVQQCQIIPQFDEMGDKTLLRVECQMACNACAFENVDVKCVVDAYCPGTEVKLETQMCEMAQPIQRMATAMAVSQVLEANENDYPIAKLLYGETRPMVSNCKVGENGVEVEGLLESTVIYMCPEGNIAALHDTMSFSVTVPVNKAVDPAARVSAQVEVEEVILKSCNSKEAHVDVKLCLVVEVYPVSMVRMIKSIAPGEPIKQGRPDVITMYFVQKGDTLWSVARKFGQERECLLQRNPHLDPSRLQPGQSVMIFPGCAVRR